MKRTLLLFIILIIVVFSLLLSSCGEEPRIPGDNGGLPVGDRVDEGAVDVTIYAFGEDIGYDGAAYYREEGDYYELPLFAIARGIGYSVVKKNESTVEIFKNRNAECFTVDMENGSVTLNRAGEEPEDALLLPPGTDHAQCARQEGDELMVDSDSLKTFITLLDLNLFINTDMNEIDILK